MYYLIVNKENNEIIDRSQLKCVDENSLNIEVTKEIFDNWEKYIYLNEEIILNPEWDLIEFNKIKNLKITENDEKRDIALNQGVLYKDILFDSDTDQKVNLLATITTMADDDSIIWFGIDNQPLLCTKQDLVNIGSLITDLHTFCWTTNARIKGLIDSSQTIAEVEAIEINYKQGE